MISAASPPPRPNPLIMIAVMGVYLALFVWALSSNIPTSVSGQAFFLILGLLAFRSWPPMVRWMTSMPVPHRAVFALMIAGIIVGHYTLHARTFYPFVAWEIFPAVTEENPVTCREFIATTDNGNKVRLLVEQLFPSIVQINPLDSFSPEMTDHLASALVKAYNQQHTDNPVRQLDLVVMAVNLHPSAGEIRAQPSCQLLKRYDFSSGR